MKPIKIHHSSSSSRLSSRSSSSDGWMDGFDSPRKSRRVAFDSTVDSTCDSTVDWRKKTHATRDDDDAIGERAHLSCVCAASAGRRRGAVDARASGVATVTRADGGSAEP